MSGKRHSTPFAQALSASSSSQRVLRSRTRPTTSAETTSQAPLQAPASAVPPQSPSSSPKPTSAASRIPLLTQAPLENPKMTYGLNIYTTRSLPSPSASEQRREDDHLLPRRRPVSMSPPPEGSMGKRPRHLHHPDSPYSSHSGYRKVPGTSSRSHPPSEKPLPRSDSPSYTPRFADYPANSQAQGRRPSQITGWGSSVHADMPVSQVPQRGRSPARSVASPSSSSHPFAYSMSSDPAMSRQRAMQPPPPPPLPPPPPHPQMVATGYDPSSGPSNAAAAPYRISSAANPEVNYQQHRHLPSWSSEHARQQASPARSPLPPRSNQSFSHLPPPPPPPSYTAGYYSHSASLKPDPSLPSRQVPQSHGAASLPPAMTSRPLIQPQAGSLVASGVVPGAARGPSAGHSSSSSAGPSTHEMTSSAPSASSSTQNPRSQAVFVNKLYTMLEDPSIRATGLLKWSDDGMGFICPDPGEFSRTILPQFFKHNNWHSFVRQLNMYGFNKQVNDVFQTLNAPPDTPVAWEFRHSIFRRGDPSSVARIKRRSVKNAHSSASQPPQGPPASQIGYTFGYAPQPPPPPPGVNATVMRPATIPVGYHRPPVSSQAYPGVVHSLPPPPPPPPPPPAGIYPGAPSGIVVQPGMHASVPTQPTGPPTYAYSSPSAAERTARYAQPGAAPPPEDTRELRRLPPLQYGSSAVAPAQSSWQTSAPPLASSSSSSSSPRPPLSSRLEREREADAKPELPADQTAPEHGRPTSSHTIKRTSNADAPNAPRAHARSPAPTGSYVAIELAHAVGHYGSRIEEHAEDLVNEIYEVREDVASVAEAARGVIRRLLDVVRNHKTMTEQELLDMDGELRVLAGRADDRARRVEYSVSMAEDVLATAHSLQIAIGDAFQGVPGMSTLFSQGPGSVSDARSGRASPLPAGSPFHRRYSTGGGSSSSYLAQAALRRASIAQEDIELRSNRSELGTSDRERRPGTASSSNLHRKSFSLDHQGSPDSSPETRKRKHPDSCSSSQQPIRDEDEQRPYSSRSNRGSLKGLLN